MHVQVRRRLGGQHTATLVIWSCDQHEYIVRTDVLRFVFREAEPNLVVFVQPLEEAGQWDAVGAKLAAAAKALEGAGCAGAIICCNSVHQAYEVAQAAVTMPILHISEVAANEILKRGLKKVALFGTRFTADRASYFVTRLEQKGLQVVLSPEEERLELHEIIFNELTVDSITAKSRTRFAEMIRATMESGGADVALLACTELSLLQPEKEEAVAGGGGKERLLVLDTAELHAMAAVDFMLADA